MIALAYPFDEKRVRALKAGDAVSLTGRLYTGRDKFHKFFADGGELGIDFRDGALYHCGPVVVKAADGAWQVYSFGPGLIEDGEITVGMYDEVDRAMASNPRTALAQVGKGHYLFVVADGRSGESQGLTLYELAQFLSDLGAGTAYNLDGGGSSAMIFQGRLVNDPSGSGRGSGERKVSDIVYVG